MWWSMAVISTTARNSKRTASCTQELVRSDEGLARRPKGKSTSERRAKLVSAIPSEEELDRRSNSLHQQSSSFRPLTSDINRCLSLLQRDKINILTFNIIASGTSGFDPDKPSAQEIGFYHFFKAIRFSMKISKISMTGWAKIGLWTTFALFIIAVLVYVGRLYELDFASKPDAFGLFGDYLGGVIGALTGLISIVFLFITYQKQIEIFKEQKRQTEIHQFEENFFHLLESFRSIIPRLKNKADKTEGYDYIKSVRNLIEPYINDICNSENALTDLNTLTTREKIEKYYGLAFGAESDQLGHYFRSLYHLLKYIDTHCKSDKKMYFDLVQAQMNTDELYLTCINGISNYGRKNMRPLLNEYSFLENLAIDDNEAIRKLVYFYYPKTKRKDINGIRNNVILIAGTEETGKGGLSLRLINERLPIRVTSIDLILMRQGRTPINYLGREEEIKEILKKKIDPDDIYVLCCNFTQLKDNGENERLSLSIYEHLHPIAVILLAASVEQMVQSVLRKGKPILNDTLAELYLENEETGASDYAAMKDVPLYRYNVENIEKAIEKIKKLASVE